MLEGPVEFCFFSGTGNTALAAGAMMRAFEAEGIRVNPRPMEDTDPATLTGRFTLGLACPAAAFTTYPLVWRFVRNLPCGKKNGAFLLVTMAGATGGLVGPMKALLKRRGWTPLGAKRLVMPSNFLAKSANEAGNAACREAALAGAAGFAADLMAGRARWTRIPLFPDLNARLFGNDRPFRTMRRRFGPSADPESCTRCGLCAEHCPTGNISMDGMPVFSDHCELCMRCHSICPAGAILLGGRRYTQYRGTPEPWSLDGRQR